MREIKFRAWDMLKEEMIYCPTLFKKDITDGNERKPIYFVGLIKQ